MAKVLSLKRREPRALAPSVVRRASTSLFELEQLVIKGARVCDQLNLPAWTKSPGDDDRALLVELERVLLDIEQTARTARGRVARQLKGGAE